MRAPIAKIKINAGNPGWYDPLTNIHLTITRPMAIVYEGSNTSNIKKAIKHGLVYVIEGTIEKEVSVIETEKPSIKEEVREVTSQVEIKTEEVIVTDDVIPTVEVQEDVQEVIEVAEEVAKVVEEKPKAKKTTKKKATTKKEEK